MNAPAAANPVELVLSRLEGVRQTGTHKWETKCPAHDDRHASLCIGVGADGRALLRCQAGCSLESVCDRLGIAVRDLFPPKQNNNGNGHGRRIVATYDYLNSEGELVYQAVRYQPKSFTQRRPDGKGGWIWNMQGVQRVLYHLPALLNSREDDPDGWVFVVEGEKDADALTRLGLIATTNVGGAGKWSDEYSHTLSVRRVCLLPDNDDPGRHHAQKVAASLSGKAAEVRVLELPNLPPKGDVSDWLSAGGTAEALLKLVDAAKLWRPDQKAEGPQPQSVRQLMQKYPALRPPVIHGLLRRGETMNVIAPPKTGKSWLVIDMAIALATGRMWLGEYQTEQGDVLILDNELHGETSAARIPKVAAARGVLVDEFADHLYVENLRGRLKDVFSLRSYFDAIDPGRYRAIVLDAFYRFLPHDADENSNATMAAIYSHLDSYADRLGCCFILIHHSTKGAQGEKSITDVGAGAGSQSRATDTHLVLRQHDTDGVAVLDAAVRSWAPIDPVCLRWEFPIWKPDGSLDPTLLRKPGAKRKRIEEAEATAAEPKIAWTPEKFVESFLTESPKSEATILCATDVVEMSERKARQYLQAAIERGIAHEWTYATRGGPKRYATVPMPVTAEAMEGSAS